MINSGKEYTYLHLFKLSQFGKWINKYVQFSDESSIKLGKLIFLQLSSEVSGRGAKTKIRGRLKDKEEEEKIAKERAELVRKDMEAKYARWNKG